MSKRRKSKVTNQAKSPSASTDLSAPIKAATAALWPKLMLACLVVACVAAAVKYSKPAPSAVMDPSVSKTDVFLPTNTCKRPPGFVRNLGLPGTISLSTSERDRLGLVVIATDPNTGKRTQVWQHPSWRMAGNLSAFTTDQKGDVYVVPAPRINLADNPPDQQNWIYRVDSQTGDMSKLLRFEPAKPISQTNPYGALGLHYDCTQDSLFVSTVAGSDPMHERGQLLRIQLTPKPMIAAAFNGIDAIGIASVSTKGQTRSSYLLIGHARSSEIRQIALDQNGNFIGMPQLFQSIFGVGPDGNERARKIEVQADGVIKVSGIAFQYNLAQASAQAKATHYFFAFDAIHGYQFRNWQP